MPTQAGSAGERGEAGKRKNDCDTQQDTERSSISTTSSATSNSNGHHWTSSSANKLSKFGRRIRDSCRNLKGRHCQNNKNPGTQSHNPEDYSSFQLPNESTRSKVYVAMDFSGRQGGRILDNPRDVRGCDKASTASKDGYVPFRRRVAAPVADKLTETQATVHRSQAWYHSAMTRDKANKILAAHLATDGVFLVRESSVAGGFVISMTASNKTIHSQVLPLSTSESVVYSIDDGKTKFYDLLQLVEFYQLNGGSLPSRLKHYIVNTDNFNPCTNGGVGGQEKTKHCLNEAQDGDGEDGETTEPGDIQSGDRAASPDSIKMTSSTSDASEAEVDSAMSQDGGSDEEGGNREQQG